MKYTELSLLERERLEVQYNLPQNKKNIEVYNGVPFIIEENKIRRIKKRVGI